MKYIVFLFLATYGALRCFSQDTFDEFVIEWEGYRSYIVKNRDYTNYGVATYDKATRELLVYYQVNVVENSRNQLDLSAKGSVMWGPKAREWIGDSIFVIKPTKRCTVYDGANVDRTVVDMLNHDLQDKIMESVSLGCPAQKY